MTDSWEGQSCKILIVVVLCGGGREKVKKRMVCVHVTEYWSTEEFFFWRGKE